MKQPSKIDHNNNETHKFSTPACHPLFHYLEIWANLWLFLIYFFILTRKIWITILRTLSSWNCWSVSSDLQLVLHKKKWHEKRVVQYKGRRKMPSQFLDFLPFHFRYSSLLRIGRFHMRVNCAFFLQGCSQRRPSLRREKKSCLASGYPLDGEQRAIKHR